MDINFVGGFSIFLLLVTFSFTNSEQFDNLNALSRTETHFANKNVRELEYRLPTSISPISYRLQILPILEIVPGYQRFTALGKIWITVNSVESTSALTLHAVALNINDTSVKVLNVNSNTQESIVATEYEERRQFYIIRLQNPTVVNARYEIYIEYIAQIPDTLLYGMYLDAYQDHQSGQINFIATTTFAAIQARRAFPCLDEPNLKATYEITIGRHNKYHSLSNAHLVSSEPISDMPGLVGWEWDKFAVTVPMSTYLVCMIVSDLDYFEAENTGTRPIRVYGTPQLIAKGGGEYSANLTANVLVEFERYYDLEYSLQKLDSVALPHFYFSAMENWGLITYTEDALLYIKDEMTEGQRYRITNVVAHEVSHQFFGNYVTCKFWTWVWLNEGFATYVSHIGVQMTYPEFEPWGQFIVNVYQNALQHDSGANTHPVENEPQTLEAQDGIYDRIAYDKGASLIRMMEGFLTEPVLQRGIQAYLKRMAYQGAEQDDLFQDLQDAAQAAGVITVDATVKDIMESWTKKSSFPLLRVSSLSSEQLLISQEAFIGEGSVDPDTTWWIPIKIATLSLETYDVTITDHWMSNEENSKTISINTDALLTLNPGSIGFYRVLYTQQMMDKIYSQLMCNHSVFSSATRSKILDDYFNLAIRNYTNLESAFRLTEYMDNEVDLFVWKTVLKSYKNATALLETRSDIIAQTHLLESKMESVLRKIGWERTNEDSSTTLLLRESLMHEACDSERRICKNLSNEFILQWSSGVEENSDAYLTNYL